MFAFLVGAALSGGVVWSLYNGPQTPSEFDRNGDGEFDERWVRSSDGAGRFEKDRNFDGRVDEIATYTRSGEISTSQTDDDFDGFMEMTGQYQNGRLLRHTLDWDHDGAIDQRGVYEHGALRAVEYLDAVTGRVVRRVNYLGAKEQGVEFDLDGDGRTDRAYALDRYDERVIEAVDDE